MKRNIHRNPARPKEPLLHPVLCLTVLDAATLVGGDVAPSTKLLLVVRDPETNPTHPNTISKPTQRIDKGIYDLLLKSTPRSVLRDNGVRYFFRGRLQDIAWQPRGTAIDNMVQGLLGTRLVGAFERRDLDFDTGLMTLQVGDVHHEIKGNPVVERDAMLNVCVLIRKGTNKFPSNTPTYSKIFWLEAQRFMETAYSRNPLLVGLDPIQYCIKGLCISCAYHALIELGIKPKNATSQQSGPPKGVATPT